MRAFSNIDDGAMIAVEPFEGDQPGCLVTVANLETGGRNCFLYYEDAVILRDYLSAWIASINKDAEQHAP